MWFRYIVIAYYSILTFINAIYHKYLRKRIDDFVIFWILLNLKRNKK